MFDFVKERKTLERALKYLEKPTADNTGLSMFIIKNLIVAKLEEVDELIHLYDTEGCAVNEAEDMVNYLLEKLDLYWAGVA